MPSLDITAPTTPEIRRRATARHPQTGPCQPATEPTKPDGLIQCQDPLTAAGASHDAPSPEALSPRQPEAATTPENSPRSADDQRPNPCASCTSRTPGTNAHQPRALSPTHTRATACQPQHGGLEQGGDLVQVRPRTPEAGRTFVARGNLAYHPASPIQPPRTYCPATRLFVALATPPKPSPQRATAPRRERQSPPTNAASELCAELSPYLHDHDEYHRT